MRIHFIRHGESHANLLHEISNRGLKHGLTRKGRQQALDLVLWLEGRPISRIYSSPVLRAIETSIILAGKLDLDYEITDALREYDCGNLEGGSDAAAWQAWHQLFEAWVVHHRWGERIEGGESFYDLRARFIPFIENLVRNYGDSNEEIVCVSHGGLYTMMLPEVLKNVDAGMISRFGFDYTACIVTELRGEALWCVEWNGQPVEQG